MIFNYIEYVSSTINEIFFDYSTLDSIRKGGRKRSR